MKPLGVRWMTKAYDYVRSKPAIVRARFAKAGIAEQYNEEFELENIKTLLIMIQILLMMIMMMY